MLKKNKNVTAGFKHIQTSEKVTKNLMKPTVCYTKYLVIKGRLLA